MKPLCRKLQRHLPHLLTLLSACLLTGPAAAEAEKAGRILVDKSERTLVLFADGRPIKSYPVSLGLNPVGHKRYEGDKRTPEGIYLIDGKNPNSAFHLSLHISYPNERDVRLARERGWDPGGQIVIHGLPTGLMKTSSNKYDYDWTDGCIAVSNTAIEEIWQLVDEGTLIEITPKRASSPNELRPAENRIDIFDADASSSMELH